MYELLAPAGSIDTFYAAISNGCTAIYLGINKFNARAYASNFNLDNLKELVSFAHLRNIKVYVTLNTIIYDFELKEAYDIIDNLALLNIDAIIVQDLALLIYALNNYKSLKTHASTQMGIDDLEGAKFLKSLGVEQIVFARETPLPILKEIKDNLDIKIETFIHGALCVAYSGNCLMSSSIGERSGNRGRCAGCCRQVYTLYDVDKDLEIKNGYLLSMKDLNTSSDFDKLRFIDSFKIEGRMKDANYVANVTSYYRGLIDKESINALTLEKIFNRTYTKGYLLGEDSKNITNILRPNNFGYEVGKVIRVEKERIYIKLFKKLSKGDQIRIESNNIYKEISVPILKLFDKTFKEVKDTDDIAIIYSKENIRINSKVYITKDSNFIKDSTEKLLDREYKRILLNFRIDAKIGKPLKLSVEYLNFNITLESSFIVSEAKNSPRSKDDIRTQVAKLNDTPYILDKLEFDIDDNIFISLGAINELRRDIIKRLNKERLNYKVIRATSEDILPKSFDSHKPIITVEVNNKEQYEVAKKLGIESIYFKNKIRRNNVTYKNITENEILVGGYGGLNHYLNQENKIIISDYSFNVTNATSVALLSSLNVSRITLSQEISKENIMRLIKDYKNTYSTHPNLELIVYGRTYVMHSKYCVLKRLNMCGKCKGSNYLLKDKFASFPLMFNDDCTNYILNCKTLNLMDDVLDLKGINYYRLVFTIETKEETKKIIENFKNILNGDHKILFNKTTDTRGHFYKNPL